MNNEQINTDPHVHNLVMCTNVFIRKNGKYLMMKRSAQKKYAAGFIHPYGGKIDPDEDPFVGALREIKEEVGVNITNMKLEAVVLEIHHTNDNPINWLIFYFSADYASGEIKKTVEGDSVLFSEKEIEDSELFPSVRSIIGHILNRETGTVFTTNNYSAFESGMTEVYKNICAL